MKKIYLLLAVSSLLSLKLSAQSPYCAPSFSDPHDACATYGININTFLLSGESSTSISNYNTGCNGTGYSDSTADTVTLFSGNTYNASINCSGGYGMNCQVWIDFNNDNIFESSESVGGLNGYTSSLSGFTISLPISAATGYHRMRVLGSFSSTGFYYPTMNACATGGYQYGEAQDYIVNVATPPACTGMPYAGVISANVSDACSSTSITLSDSGFSATSNITYQWAETADSTTDSTHYTAIAGATSPSYTFSGMDTTTYYRLIVTCENSGEVAISNRIKIISTPCYCSPAYSSPGTGCYAYGININTFLLTGDLSTSITDNNTGCNGTGYDDRTTESVTLTQGNTYTASINSSGGYQLNGQVWIDYNNDGVFEAGETIGGINGYSSALQTFSITLPDTARTGTHRMRVLGSFYSSGYFFPNLNSCATGYQYGEAHDYMVTILAEPACTGTPAAGTAYCSVTDACPTKNFELSDSGHTVAAGITHQWQQSPDSLHWTNISGATSVAYTDSGMTATTYFRDSIACANSGLSAITNGLKVISTLCYCTPAYSDPEAACYNYGININTFLLTGDSSTSITDYNTGCDGSGYDDRTTEQVSLYRTRTYPVQINSSGGYSLNAQVWIDFNNDGVFESSESVGGINGYSSTLTSFNITIPLSAPTGYYRMRILSSFTSSGFIYPSLDPCATGYQYGEAHDYMVNIYTPAMCSGTPDAGTASASVTDACPTKKFLLSDSSSSAGIGIEFQWQQSADSVIWSNITGATNGSYTDSGMTATTYFHCVVTCFASSLTATTNSVRVVSSLCFCTPGFTSPVTSCYTYGIDINTFTLTGYASSISDYNTGCNGTGYDDRTTESATLLSGHTYPCSISSANYQMNAQVWIDFNDDGVFESSESVGGVTDYSSTLTNFEIRLPIGAATGTHRMRVLGDFYNEAHFYPNMDPCASGYQYGEAHDYTIQVDAPPPCSGTPTPGSIYSNVYDGCPSTAITLTDTGASAESNIAYQWQSSPDSTSWSDISGATANAYSFTGVSATTYYRCNVTCTVSGINVYTSGIKIISTLCYCTPGYTSAGVSCFSYGININTFLLTGILGTSITDNNTGCDGSGYDDRIDESVTLYSGNTYHPSINCSGGYQVNVQIWIDFNNDGTFESSESIGGINGYTSSLTPFNITLPIGADTGSHRMRVVSSYYGDGHFYPNMDPCATSYSLGETHDYSVYVKTPPPCTGTPAAGVSAASAADACPSTTITLTDTGYDANSNITYQWQSSPDSTTWSAISGATSPSYSYSGITSAVYLRFDVTCNTGAPVSATSNSLHISSVPCYCIPGFTSAASGCYSYGMNINTFLLTGDSSTAINDSNTGCNGTGYDDRTDESISLIAGNSYVAKINCTGGYTMNVQAWIDFNNDGVFDSAESIGGLNGYTSTLTTYTLTLPGSGTIGSHRMRVLATWSSSGYASPLIDPCASGYQFGEAHDYTANIIGTACTGTPAAGTVTATPPSAFTAFTSILSLSGVSVAAGLSYQWQSSADSTTWANTSSGTHASDTVTVSTATYFRCIVKCQFTGLSDTTAGRQLTILSSGTWLGVSSTSWTDTLNWSNNKVPVYTTEVLIPAGTPYSPLISSGTEAADSLTLAPGTQITINSGATLTVKNTFTNGGTIAGGGLLNINSTYAQLIKGSGITYNIRISNIAGVTINPGDTLNVHNTITLAAGRLATNGSLVLLSDSSATARIATIPTGASITGSVLEYQYIEGGKRAYRFWAQPFTVSIPLSQVQQYIDITGAGGSANGFTSTVTNAPSAFWYNPTYGNSTLGNDPGWRAYTNTYGTPDSNMLHRYQGMRLFIRGAKGTGLNGYPYIIEPVTIGMYGTVNTGNQTVTMVKGDTSDYNLLGNPYPSPTDIGTVISNAATAGQVTGSSFYVWNTNLGTSGQFAAKPIGSPYYIGENESFEVRTTANGDSLHFTESNKGAAITDDLLRMAAENSLTLYIYDINHHPWDILSIQFNSAATEKEDSRYDAGKPPSPASLNFYSLSADGTQLSVDSRPYVSGKSVPLGITTTYQQDFIISADQYGVTGNEVVYLHDKYLSTYTQLHQGTEYKFTISNDAASQGNSRFELALGMQDAAVQGSIPINLQLLPNPATDEVTINYTTDGKAETSVSFMDVTGATVLTRKLGLQQNGSTTIALDKLTPGVYLVTFTSGSHKVVNRLIKE